MASESETIHRIQHERESLARHLNELESAVREEPQRWLFEYLPRILAASFGAFACVGFLTANRRVRT